MAVIPIQGLQKEQANPYEVTIIDIKDISIENGYYRNRREDKIIDNNIPSSIQSFGFPPNTSNPETQRILLDTPYYTYWRNKLIANRLVNNEAVLHAYHVNDLSGKPFYNLSKPTIRRIERFFDLIRIYSANVGPIDGTPVNLPFNTSRNAFYIDTISTSQIQNYQATFFFVSNPSTESIDLSDYNSLMIQELKITGNTELDWGTVLFTLVTADDIEVLCDFVTWGSRTGNMFFDNDNVSYANLTAYNLEIDISTVVRSQIKALRIQWIAGKNQGNFSPPRNWSISVKFYPSETNPQNRFARMNGQFATGLQTWAAVFSSQHLNQLYQELLVRSELSEIKYQVVGLGTRWTSSRFVIEADPKNIQWNDITTSNTNNQRRYDLILARAEGNQWLEIYNQECFVLGKSRSWITTAIGTGNNIVVALAHNVWNNPHIFTEGKAVLFDGNNLEIVSYRREGTTANQIRLIQRGTPAYSFAANTNIFFLTYEIRLRKENISRALSVGGNWFYGMIKQLDNRLVIVNPLTGEIALSSMNAPFIYPSAALRQGDGYRLYLGDLPYAIEPTSQGIQIYTLQFTYRVIFGENERSSVIQKYYTAKPRSNISTNFEYFVSQNGVFQNNQLIFESNYSEPVSRKPSTIFFDGFNLYWSYGNILYLASPTTQGVLKYHLPGNILWIQTFNRVVYCLVKNEDNTRSFIAVANETNRKSGGWIQYGKMARANLFRLSNIALWGRNIRFNYTTPNGTTIRQMDYEGEMVVDTKQPANKLTHQLDFRIELLQPDSYVARIEIDLEENRASKPQTSQ